MKKIMRSILCMFTFCMLFSQLSQARLGAVNGSRPTELFEEAKNLESCPVGTPECFAKAQEIASRYVIRRSNIPFVVANQGFKENVAVLVHSYTMSPSEMRPWAELLTAKGFNVIAPVLEAHSPDGVNMQNVTRKDWKNDMRFSLDLARQLGKNVFVLGYSLGGLMAVHSAIAYPSEIKAIGLIAPAIGISIPLASMSCLGKALINGNLANWASRQIRGTNLIEYEKDFVRGACALRGVIYDIEASLDYESVTTGFGENSNSTMESTDDHMKRVYAQLTIPIFMAYTRTDEIVDAGVLRTFLENVNSETTAIKFKKGIGHLSINNPQLTNQENRKVETEFLDFIDRNFVTN
jgi:esterase/lipase